MLIQWSSWLAVMVMALGTFVMTFPLDFPATVEAEPDAPPAPRGLRVRYRLYRLCGWSVLGACWCVLTVRKEA